MSVRIVCSGELDTGKPVRDIMTVSPKRVLTEDYTADALNLMERHEITVLPVVDPDGFLKGIVHLHDLLGKGSVNFRTLAGVGDD